ncbi:5-oxoprolinase subunit PxpB [Virgibacillus kekensis]|uniref:5-oxoprolinase subunit PxpB n=1 Tax=Virgibacillus kekensis TaxID=202261 RepID=A0ABV9DGR7_9BACI
MDISLHALGDSAVKIEFAGDVSPEMNREIQIFSEKIKNASVPGIVEWVPAFNSVTVYYNPIRLRYKEIEERLQQLHQEDGNLIQSGRRIISVPVLYGNGYGPDLERVADQSGFSVDEVIKVHSDGQYLVYMLGFLPGFPYLSGMDKRIATPRLEEPRPKIESGAVGIAYEQTGIYPIESPGGWNIIGKTPLKLFDQQKDDAFLFQAGDKVVFYPVDEKEFKRIEAEVAAGEFQVEVTEDGETD